MTWLQSCGAAIRWFSTMDDARKNLEINVSTGDYTDNGAVEVIAAEHWCYRSGRSALEHHFLPAHCNPNGVPDLGQCGHERSREQRTRELKHAAEDDLAADAVDETGLVLDGGRLSFGQGARQRR